ncbi:hypothetical protein O6H91_17G067300 [Diphasiastrum complanatum]|uniref:Uncharacterized protein n=1 Tax=Diphasiastrum complanatum TaxID=34168 RepID=A0ACC2B7P7_DIPCM|nr:hypothetical protein O6H91_17G067300 [Diphasiastrum complanatum]
MQAACQSSVWNAHLERTSLAQSSGGSSFAALRFSVCSASRDGTQGKLTTKWILRGDADSSSGGGWGFRRAETAVKPLACVEISKRSGRCRNRTGAGEEELGELENDPEEGASYIPSSDNGAAMARPSFSQLGDCGPSDAWSIAESTAMVGSCTSSSHAAAGNSRAGLFRTPISGGVQSATSSHGLPHPAIAVRNLIEQARFAHLCTIMSRLHHRRRGYPFGTLVDFAADASGHPIFSMSPLAIHTRNLLADPRCTLVVQIPGWSGLANARVTLFGDVYPLPNDKQEWAHKHYIAKQQHCASHQWGNFHYYRMESISDIYFVGGFGTVAWVDVEEYEHAHPDAIVANGAEKTLKEMNNRFSRSLREILSVETEVDDAALISIDSKGTDIRVRQGAKFNVQRLSFEEGCAIETLEQAMIALQKVLDKTPRQVPRQV